MIIGIVSKQDQTLIFQELKASNLVNDLTINEFCDYITSRLSYTRIAEGLKISIVDTGRQIIFS